MRRLVVNEAYAGQRVTGQQRYATEIARALEGKRGVTRATPSDGIASSGARSWLWVQTTLPWITRQDVLLSLTSRAPLVVRVGRRSDEDPDHLGVEHLQTIAIRARPHGG